MERMRVRDVLGMAGPALLVAFWLVLCGATILYWMDTHEPKLFSVFVLVWLMLLAALGAVALVMLLTGFRV